jgi:protocatechuate 3,4-dioxygenase beta subunit
MADGWTWNATGATEWVSLIDDFAGAEAQSLRLRHLIHRATRPVRRRSHSAQFEAATPAGQPSSRSDWTSLAKKTTLPQEDPMRLNPLLALACTVLPLAATAQVPHEAPAGAPAAGRLAPPSEPGTNLTVSGVVVSADGTPIEGASIYAYQTDAEGYYGVKPASDSRNPRLQIFLRSGARGEWSFDTIRPGSYPNSRAPGHIHFEVTAPGHALRLFEIVFEDDPHVTAEMRRNPGFSVRPVETGGDTRPSRVTERIVLERTR